MGEYDAVNHKLWVSRIDNIWLRRAAIVASYPLASLMLVPFVIQAWWEVQVELTKSIGAVWSKTSDSDTAKV